MPACKAIAGIRVLQEVHPVLVSSFAPVVVVRPRFGIGRAWITVTAQSSSCLPPLLLRIQFILPRRVPVDGVWVAGLRPGVPRVPGVTLRAEPIVECVLEPLVHRGIVIVDVGPERDTPNARNHDRVGRGNAWTRTGCRKRDLQAPRVRITHRIPICVVVPIRPKLPIEPTSHRDRVQLQIPSPPRQIPPVPVVVPGPWSPTLPSSRSSYWPGYRRFVTTVRPERGSGVVSSRTSPSGRTVAVHAACPLALVSALGIPRWSVWK